MNRDLTELVEQYEIFQRKAPHRRSPWQQFDFGLHLTIPTMLQGRALFHDKEITGPVQLQDVEWNLGEELPIPTWLFDELTRTQLRHVVATVGGSVEQALSSLQNNYLRANQRFINKEPA
jgi:hypothetical protein